MTRRPPFVTLKIWVKKVKERNVPLLSLLRCPSATHLMWALIASSGVLVVWTCESDIGEHMLGKKKEKNNSTHFFDHVMIKGALLWQVLLKIRRTSTQQIEHHEGFLLCSDTCSFIGFAFCSHAVPFKTVTGWHIIPISLVPCQNDSGTACQRAWCIGYLQRRVEKRDIKDLRSPPFQS